MFILDGSLVTTDCDRCGMLMVLRLHVRLGRHVRTKIQHCDDCLGMNTRIAKILIDNRRQDRQRKKVTA